MTSCSTTMNCRIFLCVIFVASIIQVIYIFQDGMDDSLYINIFNLYPSNSLLDTGQWFHKDIRNVPRANESLLPSIENAISTTSNTSSDHSNDIVVSAQKDVPCQMYVRPRFPRAKLMSFFHDLECIVIAFNQINHSLADCTGNILMITPLSFNYSTSPYAQIFDIQSIDDDTFYNHPNAQYRCGNSKPWMSNKNNRMSEFQQYIINRFGVRNKYNLPYNQSFYKSNLSDVLIINRHHHRGIANIDKLNDSLCSIYGNDRVRIVYFDDLSLIEQYEHILNASIIVTPHGAAETAFVMVRDEKMINYKVRLIELCPPYTHCWFGCVNGKRRPNLCPFLFGKQFKNHKIVGIGRQDVRWNCSEYCEYQKEAQSNRNWEKEFRRVNNFTVNVDLVIEAIEKFDDDGNNLLVDTVQMKDREFYFYNSTDTVTKDYFDLNTTQKN